MSASASRPSVIPQAVLAMGCAAISHALLAHGRLGTVGMTGLLLLLVCVSPWRAGASRLPAASLAGATIGLMLSLALFQGGLGGALGALLASASLAILRRAPRPGPPAPAPIRSRLCAWLGAAGCMQLIHVTTREALLPSGQDAAALVYAAAPLLLLAALGAAATAVLADRHAGLHRWLLPALLGVVVVLAIMEPRSAEGLAVLTARIQGPCVSRTQYLFGVALLAGAHGGYLALGTGALIGSLSPLPRVWHGRSWLLGMACGSLLAFPASARVLGIGMLATAGAIGASSGPARALALLLCVAGIYRAPTAIDGRDLPILDDPIRSLGGGDPATPTPLLAGRPITTALPAGWPLDPDPLTAMLRLARVMGGDSGIRLLGPEAGWVSAPTSPAQPDERTLRVILPAAAADPLAGLAPTLRRASTTTGPQPAPVVWLIDLAEVSVDDLLRLSFRLWPEDPAPAIVIAPPLAGLIAPHCFAAAVAADTTVIPLLSPDATAALRTPLRISADLALLRNTRTRRASREPRRAGERILELTRAADLLPADDQDPRFALRIRLELAAAILRDRSDEELRLLGVLGRLQQPDAPALMQARADARRALLDALQQERERIPADADVRQRLGALLLRSGQVLEGIHELTAAVTLRPKFFEAYADLTESYLDAERAGVQRSSPIGPLDNLDIQVKIERTAWRHLRPEWQDAGLLARIELARAQGELLLAARAGTTPAQQAELRERAAGRCHGLTQQQPRLAAAWRGLAHGLIALGRGNPLRQAREAARLDPADADSWALVARLTRDPREATIAERRHELLRP